MAANPNIDTPDESLPPSLKNALDKEAPVKKGDEGPVFRVLGQSKIPVSKSYGKIWKSRMTQAIKRSNTYKQAWDEAEAYFLQGSDRRTMTDGSLSGNVGIARRTNAINSEIENIVFANVTVMIPSLYAKNPTLEVTSVKAEMEDFADLCEDLINSLMMKKSAPGLNIKNKIKKSVVGTLLLNEMWIETGYTRKEDGSEQAIADLNRLSEELEKADNERDVKKIEGELMALQDKVQFTLPSGPWVKVRHPTEVLMDPAAREDDGTDANWMMICDYLPTAFLCAVYSKQGNDDERYMTIYKPTHVLASQGDGTGIDDQVTNFKLFDTSAAEAGRYGYDSDEAYKAAQYTKVWYVWDKTTRRVFMYNNDDWSWPIWVWDDPYHYDTFFPASRLSFYTAHNSTRAKGEVSYYLDQQDAINEINDESRRARLWVKRNLFYNTNHVKNAVDVEKMIKGVDETIVGVDLPEGTKWTDIIYTLPPPSINFPQLFDKQGKLDAINRIASVSDVMRGAQFKTNTTNKAIEEYNSVDNQRIDERIDSIEDFIGDVGWKVMQLCLQFMTQPEVAKLVSTNDASLWKNMDPETIQQVFNVACVGGSTQKPSSRSKKDEAIQVGQVLGQFASAAPVPVLTLTLKLLARAFENEFGLNEDDWKQLEQAIAQIPPPQPPGSQPPGTPPAAADGDGQQQTQPGGGGGTQLSPQLQAAIAKLPPQVQKAIQTAIQKGIPPDQAIKQVTEQLQAQGETQH